MLRYKSTRLSLPYELDDTEPVVVTFPRVVAAYVKWQGYRHGRGAAHVVRECVIGEMGGGWYFPRDDRSVPPCEEDLSGYYEMVYRDEIAKLREQRGNPKPPPTWQEESDKRRAELRAYEERRQAAWDALTPEEQAAKIAWAKSVLDSCARGSLR